LSREGQFNKLSPVLLTILFIPNITRSSSVAVIADRTAYDVSYSYADRCLE